MSMSAYLKRFPVLFALACGGAHAAIDAPDHILYGNVTVFGAPATFGTVVEVRVHPTGAVLARYELGSDSSLGNQFALRIPMDTVDPRRTGFARPGDPVRVFVAGQLAAETSVGADGVAVRLDLDPQNMGAGPSVAVQGRSQFEGNAATTTMNFPVSLNTTSALPVQVEWQTANGTATGGAGCAAGVDFVADDGVVTIAAGGLQGTLPVIVCGDTLVEDDETFTVQFTRVVNGVAAQQQVTGTLLDDDDVPQILLAAARVAEPAPGGSAALQFRATLSRSSDVAVSFNYFTQDIEATAGADYLATSGTATIAAGALEATVSVPVLADALAEPAERVRLVLGTPVQGALTQAEVIGTIDDSTFEPLLAPGDIALGGPAGLPTLVQPSDIAIAPDGAHAYVASESGDAVLQFARDAAGTLTLSQTWTAASAGLQDARLDAARALAISADGTFVYVAAQNSNAITVLARDEADGHLSFVQAQVDGQADATAAGGTVRGLQGASALALSPDGNHLYALGSMGNTLAVFARNAGDGRLAFVEAETEAMNDAGDAGGVVTALDRPSGLVVSPDGQNVYVAARFGNALLTFARDAASGRVSYVSVHRDGQLGIEGLGGAFALAIDGQGKHLYVASEADDAVLLFDRGAGGALVQRQRWTRGQSGLPGLDGAQSILLSHDGEELYVGGFADGSVTVFARATADAPGVLAGALAPRQTIFDGDPGVASLAGPVAIARSPDDTQVYVAANLDNAIVRFARTAKQGELFGDGFE